MATTVEGQWQDVMTAIQACHEALRAAHQRVLTTITIDDGATCARSEYERGHRQSYRAA